MRKRTNKEEGYALMLVIMVLAVVFALLMMASVQTLTTTRILALRLTHQGQALNSAHAGVVEGLDYFRRQTPPVLVFNPQRNFSVTPAIDETDVVTNPPSINRDFLISSVGNVWGHYELSRGDSVTGLFHDRYLSAICGTHLAVSCTCDREGGVADVTVNRRGTAAAAGSIWQLESIGTVYVRNDPSVPFNIAPNVIISRKTVRTEIQRVALNIPDAALVLNNPTQATIGTAGNTRARVIGGTGAAGVLGKLGGAPVVAAGATLSGSPAPNGLTAASFLATNVFNVSTLTDLAAIADHNATSVNDLPPDLPMRLVVLNVGAGTATFNAAHPLVGSGILVVQGNLTIDGGPSSYNGIIYVTGNYLQIGPSTVNGSVLLSREGAAPHATATIRGSTEFAEIYFDRFMRTQVASQLGQFRFARPAFLPCPPGDPNCNSKFAEN